MADKVHGQVLSTLPIGYALHKFIFNSDGIPCDYEYIEANKAFEDATGLNVSEIIGKRLSEILTDIEKFDWLSAYSCLVTEGTNVEFEQYAAGLGRWLRIIAYSPKQGYFVTLASDITKEKERSISLSESNKLLSDFLNSSSDVIFLKDDKLRHIFANKAFTELFGKKEIIGKDDFEIFPHEMATACRATDLEALASGERRISEEVLHDRVFEAVKFPVSYPNGTSGIGAFIKDITDQKKHEENLKRQINRQNILVDVFMKNFNNRQDLLDYTLHRALELTGSQYGYIYLYDEEKQEFTLNSWTIGVMADCEVADKQTKYKLEKTGIWGEVIRQRKPIIVNDMKQHNPLQKGFPKGHVELNNFMSIPIKVEEKIVAVAGLGNKPTPYIDIDVNEMIILMQSAWLAVEKKTAQILTIAERQKYQSILNELPAIICEFLPNGTLTFANREYYTYFEIPQEDIIERQFLDFVSDRDREAFNDRHLKLTPKKSTNDFEFAFEIDGRQRWQRWRDIGIFDKEGKPLRYYSIGFDITDQKASSEEKEMLLAQMHAMFSEHQAVMLLVDPVSNRIIDANPPASDFYGYSREDLLGMRINDINQLSDEVIAASSLRILNKQQMSFTFPHRLKNGQVRLVDVLSSPISYNGKTVLFSIIFDVSEREEAFHEIVYISYHDYLTGAYNRRYFEEEFERINTKSNFPISVIMGDVNGLKLINDSLGHHEGDNLIKEAVRKISTCLRNCDVLARIGGDEFGVILPRTNEEEANAIVHQIKHSIETSSDINETENNLLSISFGFAVQKSTQDDLGKLMKEAEGYMYNKKYYDSRSLKGKTIDIIMKTLFEKSPRDKMHSERVGNISAAIAEKLGFDQEHIDKIRVAGWLHDIGKIGIPESLLNKKGNLDAMEWTVMETHPEKSWRILENTFEYFEISNIVLCHHEKWDGSGYPKGLKGEEIPLESRIIAAADAYDAMTYNRSYRKKTTATEAMKELKRCSGTHFDPKVIEVFVEQVLTREKDFLTKDESDRVSTVFDLNMQKRI